MSGKAGTTCDFKAISNAESQVVRRTFPLPSGWRVVCRLSPSDPRSRWGARPRPAPSGSSLAPTSGGPETALEADLFAPELRQPLKVPLQLLPKWTEPQVGIEFLGRYEVRKLLPQRPGARGRLLFEVADKRDKGAERNLRVMDLAEEVDMRAFAERLQLESLDSDGRLFVKLHDLSVAIPGHVAAVEDAVRCSLWQEFANVKPGRELVAKVGSVAKAALTGLCRLHANGWVHCGVSPHSVVLTRDGCWKLTGLECARRVRELAALPLARLGSAASPEALLGLTVTEKVDVWQLGATISEAIVQKRVDQFEDAGAAAAPVDIVQWLCRLIDFVGPLPESLVARHPCREDLFTPEGHVLRPVTPDGTGTQKVEAIEPAAARTSPAADDGAALRPPLLAEKLANVEGAADILEFLGRLLTPDPEQRPSAGEALAHHFLRFVQTKTGGGEGGQKAVGFGSSPKKETSHAKIQDSHGDNESKLTRKGTGFVHLGELPHSDDEDDEEEEPAKPASGKAHVKIQDTGGGEAPRGVKLARKGTGFVHTGEVPASDDEEEVEDVPVKKGHAKIQDAHGDNESKLARKGTGFVHLGELPTSDEEEDDEEEVTNSKPAKKGGVRIQDDIIPCKEDEKNKLARKGTGFVHMNELPASDDEEGGGGGGGPEEGPRENQRHSEGGQREQISEEGHRIRAHGRVAHHGRRRRRGRGTQQQVCS